jgi:hypothetical protein
MQANQQVLSEITSKSEALSGFTFRGNLSSGPYQSSNCHHSDATSGHCQWQVITVVTTAPLLFTLSYYCRSPPPRILPIACITVTIAWHKIVKALTGRERTFNALFNQLTFNGQQIVGLCNSLTVSAVNFLKIGNITFNGVKTFFNDVHISYEKCHSLPYFRQHNREKYI